MKLEEPVNKFPDLVAYFVRHLKVLSPSLGKVRIAQMLARAGLHLSASTVGRMARRAYAVGGVPWTASSEPTPALRAACALAEDCPVRGSSCVWSRDVLA